MECCDQLTSKYRYAISENHLTHVAFFCTTPRTFTLIMECHGWWSGEDALWFMILHSTFFCTPSKLRLSWNAAINEPALMHKYICVHHLTRSLLLCYISQSAPRTCNMIRTLLSALCVYHYTYRKILDETSQSGLLVHSILLWCFCVCYSIKYMNVHLLTCSEFKLSTQYDPFHPLHFCFLPSHTEMTIPMR